MCRSAVCRSTGRPSAATTRAPTRLPSSIDFTGKRLVGAVGVDAKRHGAGRRLARQARDRVARHLDGGVADRRLVGGHDARERQRDEAEHAGDALGGLLGVGVADAHEDAAVRRLDARLGHARDGGLHVAHEHALEALAVAALEEQLAIAAQQDRLRIHVGGGVSTMSCARGERSPRFPRRRRAARPRRRRRRRAPSCARARSAARPCDRRRRWP